MKGFITTTTVLSFPDFSHPFFIHTDTCYTGLGAALKQQDDAGRNVAMAYASCALHGETTLNPRESLAVIWALEHFRTYIDRVY